jgi:hypothetical protein
VPFNCYQPITKVSLLLGASGERTYFGTHHKAPSFGMIFLRRILGVWMLDMKKSLLFSVFFPCLFESKTLHFLILYTPGKKISFCFLH